MPAGRAKFIMGLVVGVAAWASGPPLQSRSKQNMARPWFWLSLSVPTDRQLATVPGATVMKVGPPLSRRRFKLVADAGGARAAPITIANAPAAQRPWFMAPPALRGPLTLVPVVTGENSATA